MGAGQSQPLNNQQTIGLGVGLGIGLPVFLGIIVVITQVFGLHLSTVLATMLGMSALISFIWLTYAEVVGGSALQEAAIGVGVINGLMLIAPGVIVMLNASAVEAANYEFFMIHLSIILSVVSLTSNVLVKLNS